MMRETNAPVGTSTLRTNGPSPVVNFPRLSAVPSPTTDTTLAQIRSMVVDERTVVIFPLVVK